MTAPNLALAHDLAGRAADLDRQIVDTVQEIRERWVTLAAYLHEFIENRMYEPLDFPTLEAWLQARQVGLARSRVLRLTKVYKALVLDRGVSPERLTDTEITKLEVALPAVKDGRASVDEAIADTKRLSRLELSERYSKAKSIIKDFEIGDSDRKRKIADNTKQRLTVALSAARGGARALPGFPLEQALATADDEDIRVWMADAAQVLAAYHRLRDDLKRELTRRKAAP